MSKLERTKPHTNVGMRAASINGTGSLLTSAIMSALSRKPNIVTRYSVEAPGSRDINPECLPVLNLRVEIDYNDITNPVLVSATLEKK